MESKIIVLVGAGGKTTISKEIVKRNLALYYNVLFTTTTKILNEPTADVYIGDVDALTAKNKFQVAAKKRNQNFNLIGYTADEIARIADKKLFDYIVVEADGANMKCVKAPKKTEPVYPRDPNLIIGVIGLDSLGMVANDKNVHSFDLFKKVTKIKENEKIQITHLINLINHDKGLFFKAKKQTQKIVFLNKCDTVNKETTEKILKRSKEFKYPIFLTSQNDNWFSQLYEEYFN